MRANITWKHCINSNLLVSTSISIINNIKEDNKNDNIEIEKNIEKDEKENLTFQNNNYETDELDLFINTKNIIHPAIDSDAKWKLELLFKDLEFPF